VTYTVEVATDGGAWMIVWQGASQREALRHTREAIADGYDARLWAERDYHPEPTHGHSIERGL
jgi:hypothetical protein